MKLLVLGGGGGGGHIHMSIAIPRENLNNAGQLHSGRSPAGCQGIYMYEVD